MFFFLQKYTNYLAKPISKYKILANKVFKTKTYPNIQKMRQKGKLIMNIVLILIILKVNFIFNLNKKYEKMRLPVCSQVIKDKGIWNDNKNILQNGILLSKLTNFISK